MLKSTPFAQPGNLNSTTLWISIDKMENRLDVFPAYVDCFCLRCQGHEVPEMVGDHHNTGCGCDRFKRTDFAVTNSRIFPHLKEVAATKLTKQKAEALISYSPLFSLLNPPASLRWRRKQRNFQKQILADSSTGDMKDASYNSATNECLLQTSRLCARLAATGLRLEQQQAELLTPPPIYHSFNMSSHEHGLG